MAFRAVVSNFGVREHGHGDCLLVRWQSGRGSRAGVGVGTRPWVIMAGLVTTWRTTDLRGGHCGVSEDLDHMGLGI